ncbi:MAG: pentapeptide repeat-containing protein [Theionarchaea archaeon]|nr:pentapeptide repeat-containing protein [Theionarchaea archaeon]
MGTCSYRQEEWHLECQKEIWGGSGEFCIFHDPSPEKNVDLFKEKLEEQMKSETREQNFIGYYFPKNWDFLDADFSRTPFQGTATFFGAAFQKADFRGATFQGTATFFGAAFQKADFRRVTFQGEANFMKTDFQEADFRAATFQGTADFWDATFPNANFNDTAFQDAEFTEATFLSTANFRAATFQGTATFLRTTFQKAEFVKTTFHRANFSGVAFQEAEFEGATFQGTADFWDATFLEANFNDTIFEEADFRGSTFQGNADFVKATFQGDADFSGVTFHRANFRGATFQESNFNDITCQGAHFNETTFNKRATFVKATFQGTADFMMATFQDADFEGATFKRADFRWTNFKNAYFRNITVNQSFDFCPESVSEMIDFQESKFLFSGSITVNLEKARFRRAYLQNVDFIDCKWPDNYTIFEESNEDLSFNELETIYRNLKQSMQHHGNYTTAGEFYYREMECRKKSMRKTMFSFNWPKSYVYSLLKYTCGYGERPSRVIGVSLLIILFSALFFQYSGIVMGEHTIEERVIDHEILVAFPTLQSINDYLQCVYYSFVTFTTLGYGDIHPLGYSKVIACAESFAGAFFIALFVLVFGRKMMR